MAGQQKTMTGRVVSDKMDKTVVVQVQSTTRHRLYHKILRRSKRYLAHDEGDAKPGDLVLLEETRPLSRHKRWRVAQILRRGDMAEIAPREIDSEYLSMEREVETPAAPAPKAEAPAETTEPTAEAQAEEPAAAAEAAAEDTAAPEETTEEDTPEAAGDEDEA